MNKMSEDLSKLTTIPENILIKLFDKIRWIIGDAICEANSDLVEIDIGIGTLLLSNELEHVRYKFIPDDSLDETIRNCFNDHISPIEQQLEKRFIDRIIHTYKDIL